MNGGEAIDVLATLELDCRAYSELIASLGYRIGVVSIASAAGVAALHGSAARALVLVTDEADADLISGIRVIRAEHPGLRVIAIGRDESVAPWVGVANFVVPRRANARTLRAGPSLQIEIPGATR